MFDSKIIKKKTGLDLTQNIMSKLTEFGVWECNSNYSLKYFLLENILKLFFLFFKNYFLYQHIKTIWKYKKIILNKNISIF